MTGAETEALRALVATDPVFAAPNKLFVGRALGTDGAPITGTWYVVLQPGGDIDRQDRITGGYVYRHPSVTFQCVGTTPAQTQWVTDRLDAALRSHGVGKRLQVPGVRTGPLRRDHVAPVQIDPDISPPMWFQSVDYSFDAQPTSIP